MKSTIHWVFAAHAVDAEVHLYDKLFTKPDPNEIEENKDFTANLNPNSLEIVGNAKVEPALADPAVEARHQFERIGYFCADPDSKPGKPVFNRTVALKDTCDRERTTGKLISRTALYCCTYKHLDRETIDNSCAQSRVKIGSKTFLSRAGCP